LHSSSYLKSATSTLISFGSKSKLLKLETPNIQITHAKTGITKKKRTKWFSKLTGVITVL
jgi:hypothetical protein